MIRHELASLAVLALGALTVLGGCPEDGGAPPSTGPTAKPSTRATSATTGTAAATGKPAASAAAAPTGPTGSIKGVVNFAGKVPEMKVPTKRKDADVCKDKELKLNAVAAQGGKLKDAFIKVLGVKGKWDPPGKAAEIDQRDCVYEPRIQGVVSGQEVTIKNGDATLHNVHIYKGTETLDNKAQPKGAPAIIKSWDDTGVVKFACDVHPWMRGFVVVHDSPFFDVSKADGTFTIDKVPVGKYEVEAWHSQFGMKKASVEVAEGKTAEIKFDYSDKDQAPPENADELKGPW